MGWDTLQEFKRRNKWKKIALGVIGSTVFAMSASYTVKAEEITSQDETRISETVDNLEKEDTRFVESEETIEVLKSEEELDAETTKDDIDNSNSQMKPEEDIIETGWVSENGTKYFQDEKGKHCTGWLSQEEGWYYLDPEKDGAMVADGWKYIDSEWYYFNKDGTMKTGWIYYAGSWYHLSISGSTERGWSYIDGKWYYFLYSKDGAMLSDCWEYINSEWYYFDASGAMQSDWLYDRGFWYYLDANGAMQNGWNYIRGSWYYLNPSNGGRMVSSQWSYINSNWYYFTESGRIFEGWLSYCGDWYYLYPANNAAGMTEGAMAKNTTIDGYLISMDGIYNDAYQGAYNVLNQVGWNLWSAYSWSASLPYVNYSNDPSPGSKNFAIHGFQTKTGDCYVMAATFYYMAKALGYDAHQMAGYVPLRGGGLGVHSWVEIDMDGSTYVFDPDFTHEAKRNGYQITYGMSGTWKYSNYYRMN